MSVSTVRQILSAAAMRGEKPVLVGGPLRQRKTRCPACGTDGACDFWEDRQTGRARAACRKSCKESDILAAWEATSRVEKGPSVEASSHQVPPPAVKPAPQKRAPEAARPELEAQLNDSESGGVAKAERAVLGSLLTDSRFVFPKIADLPPESFATEQHRVVYVAALTVAGRDEAAEPLTVENELRRTGRFELAGGSAYLAGLIDGIPDIGNVEAYARIVREASRRRRRLVAHSRAVDDLKSGVCPDDVDANFRRTHEEENHVGCLRPESLASILDRPEEETRWLVEDLLPAAGTSLLVAKPKAGKSTLSRQLAVRVARGEPFLGRETQKGPVLVLAFEEKMQEARRHLRGMGATRDDDIHLHFGGANGNVVGDLRAIIERTHPVLVIVDSLFRGVRVKDANDYAVVLNALAPWMDLARETGAHVLATHHAGKGERHGADVILGSTAIFGAVDTAIILKRGEEHRTIATVQRYGDDLPETVLAFDKETRTSELAGTKAEADESRISGEILAALEGKPEPIEEDPLLADVEARIGSKRQALRKLIKEGKVARVGKGKKGDPYRYSTDSGFLVPPTSGNERNENPKMGGNPLYDGSDSRSGLFGDSEGSGTSGNEHFEPPDAGLSDEEEEPPKTAAAPVRRVLP